MRWPLFVLCFTSCICAASSSSSTSFSSSSQALYVSSVSRPASSSWSRPSCGAGNLLTVWGNTIDPDTPTLTEYPRPQLQRDTNFTSLNGLWEFQPAKQDEIPVFGKSLNSSILVPFPPESCLSGLAATTSYMFYRLVMKFDFVKDDGVEEQETPKDEANARTILHFEAVDWKVSVFLNTVLVGVHTGGYSSFSFDITSLVSVAAENELFLVVYDPSETGFQPNGKQFIRSMINPGGDTYTPSSGIWAPVWIEHVPSSPYITSLLVRPQPTLDAITVALNVRSTSSSSSTPSQILQSTILNGGDIPGYPIDVKDVDECWRLCNTTVACVAWTFALDGCAFDPHLQPSHHHRRFHRHHDRETSSKAKTPSSQCYLKDDTFTVTSTTACFTSGVQPTVSQAVSFNFTVTSDTGGFVTSAVGVMGKTLTIPLPKPVNLWSPENPFLYGATVTLLTASNYDDTDDNSRDEAAEVSDTVSSYFGVRWFELVDSVKPASDIQWSVDRPGSDLPGSPFIIASGSASDCQLLCQQQQQPQQQCIAWAFAAAGCKSQSEPARCWLKSSSPSPTSADSCMASGELSHTIKIIQLNGQPIFLNGWLDQSFWPDGLYTAPTDTALSFDLAAVRKNGLNAVRLHQKVNRQRWYWYADRMGVLVIQDMIQKYGDATPDTVTPFMWDLRSMILETQNHPSIIQWTAFNEDDCWKVFDVPSVVSYIRSLDPTRPVDADSGGNANSEHVGDVNDFHTYPDPGYPTANRSQYAMLGEFGGIGAFISGHEWVPSQCTTYEEAATPTAEVDRIIGMLQVIQNRTSDIRSVIYTQITDVERECDGYYNYDRTAKFSQEDAARLAKANMILIKSIGDS